MPADHTPTSYSSPKNAEGSTVARHVSSNAAPLRIAIVTSIHPDFDGRIWKHARSLAEAGCEVHLVCPWTVPTGEIRDGVRLYPFSRVERRALRPFLIPFRLGRRLLPLLRQVDVVHFHDIDILPWMALLSPIRPVVYDVHENYPDEMLVRDWIPRLLRRPFYHGVRIVEGALARMIGHCVLVVPAQDERFRVAGLRVIHIRNYATRALLAETRDDYAARDPLVVFTGAHHDNNGSMLLLDIAARSQARGLDIKFLMTDRYASEAFRRRFVAEIARLGLGHRVCIRRYVAPHRIMSLLSGATIAISPNLRVPAQEKAIPTKLFEYMAAALPIVTSNLPNQAVIVADNHAGLLARPEEPETFVDALEELVRDRRYARELGLNGRRAFTEKYCWESQIPDLLRFYDVIRTPSIAAPRAARL
jgi:glycosyltransferase involved in cell wall biosynthesis